MSNYEDIINIEHFEPKYHKRMSIYNRLAQFAPFEALTGYSDSIAETGRLIVLSEEKITQINNTLQLISQKLDLNPKIKITYYVPDKLKIGGTYYDYLGYVKKIKNYEKEIIFTNNLKISFNDIIKIDLID